MAIYFILFHLHVSFTLLYSILLTGIWLLECMLSYLIVKAIFTFKFIFVFLAEKSFDTLADGCISSLPVACLFICHILLCNSANTNAEWNARSIALYAAAVAAWWGRLQLAVLQTLPM